MIAQQRSPTGYRRLRTNHSSNSTMLVNCSQRDSVRNIQHAVLIHCHTCTHTALLHQLYVSKNTSTRRKKSNSHYAPQPYTNQSVFKSLLNYASEMSLSRNATGTAESSRDTVQRRKNSCLRDAFVFFLWHTSRRLDTGIVFRIRHYWEIRKMVPTYCAARRACSSRHRHSNYHVITSLAHDIKTAMTDVPWRRYALSQCF